MTASWPEGATTIGAYVVRERKHALLFTEPNSRKMQHHVVKHVETLLPTRFIAFSAGWTGRGTMSPPNITAHLIDDTFQIGALAESSELVNPIPARRHGPVYREMAWRTFLVDLGQEYESRSHLRLHVETEYVDEAGTFKPYLTGRVDPGLESSTLMVGFRSEISNLKKVIYSYRASSDDLWAFPKEPPEGTREEVLTRQGAAITTVEFNLDCNLSGMHRITW